MGKVRGEKDLSKSQQGKNTWPTVARGIDRTSNSVQLNGFFREKMYNLFLKVQRYLRVHFFSLFVNLHFFLPWSFSSLNIFQAFSLNFVRTLGRAQLNGSDLNSHGQLFLESKV